ncbi:phage tail protein [Rhizobium grahamii]|uniref:phage tail protein n=1 Tax=Rhizobium grahamii TaxID=1120045 RepID=UPI000E0C1BE9
MSLSWLAHDLGLSIELWQDELGMTMKRALIATSIAVAVLAVAATYALPSFKAAEQSQKVSSP